MTKKQKGLIILLTPFFMGFVLGLLVGRCSGPDRAEPEARLEEPSASQKADDLQQEEPADISDDVDGTGIEQKQLVAYYAPKMSYAKVFSDLNEEHLEAARRVGLRSVPKTRAGVDTSDGLVDISSSDYYVVDDLRYSIPYLTKGAARELETIARAFCDSLKSKKLLDEYRLVVSSVLRTEEDVNRLRRSGNPNASENSAHCYGTTFDITYTRYYREEDSSMEMPPYELTKVLAEVLRDERNAGHCLVKYERKEHCFHITSTLSR